MGRIESFQFTDRPEIAASIDAALAQRGAPAHRQGPWTQAEVAALMSEAYAPPSGRPGDQAAVRQQLSSAFLAGVAKAQEELLLKPRGSLVAAAVREARALMKNRAARHEDRLWHAFSAGARAARATAGLEMPLQAPPLQGAAEKTTDRALKLFVRQPLTESGESHQALIADVLACIDECNEKPHRFDYLTGRKAESAATFRASFEAESGQPFTPENFRAHRLQRLAQADAFVNIRVGMSESSAFELSYHVFRGACSPVLFLVWKHAPIKTTLLKDLHNLCDVTYLEFEHASDLREGLARFFERCTLRPAPRVAA